MKKQLIKEANINIICIYAFTFLHIQTKDRSQCCSSCYATDFLEFDTHIVTPAGATSTEQGTEGCLPWQGH